MSEATQKRPELKRKVMGLINERKKERERVAVLLFRL